MHFAFLLFAASTSTCLIEENFSYNSYDVNNGWSDPKQNDAESCRAFCESTYPTASFFEWYSPSNYYKDSNPGSINSCWCSTSNAGRTPLQGHHSGEICRGVFTTTATSTTLSTSATTTTTSTSITTTAATASSTAACLIEEISYGQGSALNDGLADPKRNDAERCRSFCKSNHPTTTYFTWISTTSSWTQAHKRCFCKTSNAGPVNNGGAFSGNVHCVGKRLCILL